MTQPNLDRDLLNQVHVAVIRLDGKFDSINQELRRISDESLRNHVDHESRIRFLEAKPAVSVERFLALETRPYVSPATVWKIVGTILTFASLAVAVVGLITR